MIKNLRDNTINTSRQATPYTTKFHLKLSRVKLIFENVLKEIDKFLLIAPSLSKKKKVIRDFSTKDIKKYAIFQKWGFGLLNNHYNCFSIIV